MHIKLLQLGYGVSIVIYSKQLSVQSFRGFYPYIYISSEPRNFCTAELLLFTVRNLVL